ncbi:MAG: nucleotidyltransferase domain-containing protein [Spirochaetales bacterium]|nr:nucleotidyltransferase domain-containing protein [Spirochaetales bacterium]MBO7349613.1 nucleotidyltransferase domain-containing protein [Spirochaetales bacterium]
MTAVCNDLKAIRKTLGLTQKEVAVLAGVSLRSYKTYENEVRKKETPVYKYILELLQRKAFIDEDHGILTLDSIKDKCTEVFKQYDVEYCYLFGSYSRSEAKETSDVDLLVSTPITGMDFYGMAERLRLSLHKRVDLLGLEQLSGNPELLHDILKEGIKIYEKAEG